MSTPSVSAQSPASPRLPVVLVTGVPAAGKTTLARALSAQLGIPLLSKDRVKEELFDTLGELDRARLSHAASNVLWSLLPDCPGGALVELWLDPRRDTGLAAQGLARAAVSWVLEILCVCPGDIATQRYAARTRHPAHLPPDETTLQRIRDAAPLMQPLGIGPALRVDTTSPVDVEPLAGWVRAAALDPPAMPPSGWTLCPH